MAEDQLKPCPFCGSSDLKEESGACIDYHDGTSHQDGWIGCKGCGAWGPNVELINEEPYQKVREAWNRRA
jgi:Lar family restriction alleviation protein